MDQPVPSDYGETVTVEDSINIVARSYHWSKHGDISEAVMHLWIDLWIAGQPEVRRVYCL